ncbi:MAG TPA: hypothetical protein VGG28_09805 [Kofleriaceae bacterium]
MRWLVAIAIVSVASASPAKPTTAQQIALAQKLAAALDRGAPLGDVADPVEGIHVWWTPGSEEIEQTQFRATDKPSAKLADVNMTPYMKQHYAGDVAAGVRYALAHLDVDPAKPDAAAYQIDCMRSDVRAPRATLSNLVLERVGGVKVTFVVRNGKLYVSSIHAMTPCEA